MRQTISVKKELHDKLRHLCIDDKLRLGELIDKIIEAYFVSIDDIDSDKIDK